MQTRLSAALLSGDQTQQSGSSGGYSGGSGASNRRFSRVGGARGCGMGGHDMHYGSGTLDEQDEDDSSYSSSVASSLKPSITVSAKLSIYNIT